MISPTERCAQQVADAIARNSYAASPRSARQEPLRVFAPHLGAFDGSPPGLPFLSRPRDAGLSLIFASPPCAENPSILPRPRRSPVHLDSQPRVVR